MNQHSETSPVRPDSLQRLRTCIGIWLPFLFLATFFFGTAYVHQEQFLFRDAAHFYYPLFHEVTRQWKAGEIPLWSPFDGIGMPLAADATPSVFYPGKLLLLTPLGFGFGMRTYVLLHFALAYGGMFWAARTWGCSTVAAVLAATAYAFGGPVLSYHSNVIFLVGASWLPFALACGWLLVRRPALLSGVGLALALTMMILGGDPQLAFHTMMMLTLAAIFFVFPWRRLPSLRVWLTWRSTRVGALVGCAVLAAGLSAIQILPTSEWASRSLRATSDHPRSVYELASGVGADQDDRFRALLGSPDQETHARHSYDFSIGPWNWPGTFIANFSGQMYPRNERWTRAIPAEGRIWFASLFMGSLVVLLAGYAIFRRRLRRADRWLVAIGLFGLIASLGWYGLGWLILEVGHGLGWDGESLPIGSPFGGLYWLLNMVVPRYAQFRYPAKWWIFLAFAVPLLAGRGLDQVQASKRLAVSMLALTMTFGVAATIVWFTSSSWAAMMPHVPDDALFGPLDTTNGLRQMAVGLMHGALAIAGAMAAICFLPRRLGVTVIVMIAMAELMLANRWVAPSASQDLWNPISHDQTTVHFKDKRILRTSYFDRSKNHYPPSFAATGSDDRMVEGLKFDQRHNFPRFHLLKMVREIPSVVSIRPRDMETVWKYRDKPLVITMLGKQHGHTAGWPDMWWQTNVQWHDPIDASSPTAVARGTQEVLDQVQATKLPAFPRIRASLRPSKYHWAWNTSSWYPTVIEAESGNRPSFPALPPTVNVFTEPKRPRAGQLQVNLANCQPGWLMLQEYFDYGWQCEILDANGNTRHDVAIYRANRILMAVPVQKGDQQVTLTYWPQSFVIGAIVSGLSWLALAVCLAANVCLTLFKRR
ncbi:YfhO family protein [Bremerella sp. JC770]|uniref:YfhO family protein n=1 Tax=Bremerella sp. JC770 TaxID=3232137 RepID=UPI00345AD9C7